MHQHFENVGLLTIAFGPNTSKKKKKKKSSKSQNKSNDTSTEQEQDETQDKTGSNVQVSYPVFPSKKYWQSMTKPKNYNKRASELLEYFQSLVSNVIIINDETFQQGIQLSCYLQNQLNYIIKQRKLHQTMMNMTDDEFDDANDKEQSTILHGQEQIV